MLQRIFIGIIFILFALRVEGQSLRLTGPDLASLTGRRLPVGTYTDSLAAKTALENWLEEQRQSGYLEASIDRIEHLDSIWRLEVHLGPLYYWGSLDLSNIPPEAIASLKLQRQKWAHRPVNFKQLDALKDQLLRYAENNGYPFAAVWVDTLGIDGQAVNGRIRVEAGPLFTFDSIQVVGSVDLSASFLQRYLGLYPDSPFDKSRIDAVQDRLQNLSFVTSREPARVTFNLRKASLTIPLEKKNASRFDFIIGVLPNNSQTGRLLITGKLEGELSNQFGRGERIYAHFEQLRPATQRLELELEYPYLLDLPFGVDLAFDLYKRDSSFLDVETDLGVQYLLPGGDYFKAFWGQRNSSLLTINERQLLNTLQLPPTLDVRYGLFGVEYLHQALDYRLNPRRGWLLQIKLGAGTKKIIRNSEIEALELGFLYDSISLRSFQYQIDARIAGYIPLGRRSVLELASSTGWLLSDAPIYRNEQYRIGGNNLLRGFDEEFYFATHYVVNTVEYRLLISQNSYLFGFFDLGFVEDRTAELRIRQWPYGFGTGISLETTAGLFGISLAFGKQKSAPVDFSSPKVHFGYISLF